jgi:hypothetical protein
MVVSTVLAAAWPFNDFEKGVELESLDALQLLFVWGYVLGMFLVQDTSKYFFYQTLLAYDFEGIKTSADLQAVRAAGRVRRGQSGRPRGGREGAEQLRCILHVVAVVDIYMGNIEHQIQYGVMLHWRCPDLIRSRFDQHIIGARVKLTVWVRRTTTQARASW